jgi:hypothetical protein
MGFPTRFRLDQAQTEQVGCEQNAHRTSGKSLFQANEFQQSAKLSQLG